ncbi:MAG: hypothetical protein ACRD0Y_04455 [Terriglobales bacterium]
MSTTDILLIIFIAVAALALLAQWIVLASLASRFGKLSEKIEPLIPQVAQTAAVLGPLVRDVHAMVSETRPRIEAVSANVAEMSALARDQLRRADAFAGEFAQRLELQMVRVDDALGSALASVDQIASTVRDTVLRPVNDVNAMMQGVRTGLDFFFRRRSGPPSRPVYQDDEMFI